MGMIKLKSLISLHLHPYSCFHLPSTTTNKNTTTSSPPPICRLISSVDGQVMTFHHPIPAGQLMAQHPLHLICRSDSFFIGQKVPPLSPSDNLIPGHSYFLLPSHFFHSVLSFLTLTSSLFLIKTSISSNMENSKRLINMFDIRKTDNGVLEVRIKEEVSMEEEEEGMMNKGVCTSEGLEKEYKRLVGGCKLREWKPRLETIKESSREKKTSVKRRLMLIRRRKKRGVEC